jgi:hypothetical protein
MAPRRVFGQTGLEISEVTFGTWALGGDWRDVPEPDAIAGINAAIVNLFDPPTSTVAGERRNFWGGSSGDARGSWPQPSSVAGTPLTIPGRTRNRASAPTVRRAYGGSGVRLTARTRASRA